MGLFDDGMSAAASVASVVMGEDVTLNGVTVTGTVGPATVQGSRDPARGGRYSEQVFDVHLTLEAAVRCAAADGNKISTAAGRKGRVDSVEHLGAGGVILHCGPVNREQD